MMRAPVAIAVLLVGCTYEPKVLESPCVPQVGPPELQLSPEVVRDVWLPPGEVVELRVAVRRSDCRAPKVEVGSHPEWAKVSFGGILAAGVLAVDLTIDPLAAGERRAGSVVLVEPRDSRIRGEVALDLRALLLDEIHVGTADQACPRPGGTACDFIGGTGLRDAVEAHAEGGVHIFLHDDAGERATYDTATLYRDSWVSAAPGTRVDNVVLRCNGFSDQLLFAGSNVRLEGVTLALREHCETAFSAHWQDSWSAGHLVQNVIGAFVAPELFGSNGLQGPFVPGDRTTVRNSFFWGFHEGNIELEHRRGVRIVSNTFVSFQQVEGVDYQDMAFVWAENSNDTLIANNVFVAMSAEAPVLARANEGTVGLQIIGNAAEGVTAVVAGLNPLDASSEVRDNRLGETLDLLSPLEPRFLADSAQVSTGGVGSEGVSLDGVDGGGWSFPGAFRARAERELPRPDVVRVGPEPGRCGGDSCDTWIGMPSQVQWAVWRAWPRARVELYPSEAEYGGMVIVTWPVTLVGMGDGPEDVVLRSLGWDAVDADPFLDSVRGDGVLTIASGVHSGPVVVENLSLRDTDVHVPYGVMVEPAYWPRYRQGIHELRRLRIETADPLALYGIGLGGGVRVQDSLVLGDYRACAEFGPRPYDTDAIPSTSNALINITCRLTSPDVEAAFLVAQAYDSAVVNVVAETAVNVPIFRAQERLSSSGLWEPQPVTGLTAHASTYAGFGAEVDGFDASGSAFDIDVSSATTLFVSAEDSHLASGSPALDAGADPRSYGAPVGVSLDGIDRAGWDIDQGCYEQGR